MNNLINIQNIVFNETLQNTNYRQAYLEFLEEENVSTSLCNPFIVDVAEVLNTVIYNHSNLTEFQKDILQNIFEQFNVIRDKIDPNRLKPFEYSYTDDEELLLYRRSENGLTNIIINSDECAVFSFISSDNKKSDQFFIIDNNSFEDAALNFFAF